MMTNVSFITFNLPVLLYQNEEKCCIQCSHKTNVLLFLNGEQGLQKLGKRDFGPDAENEQMK